VWSSYAPRGKPKLSFSAVRAALTFRLASRRDGIDAAGDLFRDVGVRCVFASANDDRQMRIRAEPFGPEGWLAKNIMASLISVVGEAVSKPN
jgi:two-component system, response regulator PdtaR